MSTWDFFNYYIVQSLENIAFPQLSFTTFQRFRDSIPIKISSYDFSAHCPFCDPMAAIEAIVQNDKQTLVDEEEEKYEGRIFTQDEIDNHKRVLRIQREAFQTQKNELRQEEVLIVKDFTAQAIPYGKSAFLYANFLIFTKYERKNHGSLT